LVFEVRITSHPPALKGCAFKTTLKEVVKRALARFHKGWWAGKDIKRGGVERTAIMVEGKGKE
jgi:hypothetical protein